MKRRDLFKSVGRTIFAGGVTGSLSTIASAPKLQAEPLFQDPALPEITWQMPTSWSVALDVIYSGAQAIANSVSAMTDGKFTINVRYAGELTPALEVLNVVQEGTFPIGHTASYYYIGQSPIMAFGASLPFGLTARQQNAWLYEGGGLELLQEQYVDRFGVIQFPAGNLGMQMGGWFNKEIRSLRDLNGLKMRITGLGAQVMVRLGVNVQVLPGGEIFQALATGSIDAAEWVGPYDDERLGLHKAARFYYYPGWWEPGVTLDMIVNYEEYNALPQEYQIVLQKAAYEANLRMMADYDHKNALALNRLLQEGVVFLPFPDDVMTAAEAASFELFDQFVADDSDFQAIFENWSAYRTQIQQWHSLAEATYAGYNMSKTLKQNLQFLPLIFS